MAGAEHWAGDGNPNGAEAPVSSDCLRAFKAIRILLPATAQNQICTQNTIRIILLMFLLSKSYMY